DGAPPNSRIRYSQCSGLEPQRRVLAGGKRSAGTARIGHCRGSFRRNDRRAIRVEPAFRIVAVRSGHLPERCFHDAHRNVSCYIYPGPQGVARGSRNRLEVRMMRWVDKLLLRLRSLLRRPRVERELDTELRFHLEQQVEENLAAGMTPEEARYAARRSIGGVAQIREECRDMRRVNWVQDLAQDIRYGLRMLRKSPS